MGGGGVKFVRNSSRRSGAGSNRIDPSKPVKRQNKAEIKHPDRKMEPPFVRTMNAGWSAAFAGLPYRSGTLHRRHRRPGVHHGSPCRPKICQPQNLPRPTLRPGRPKRNRLPEFRPVELPEHLQQQPRSRSTDRPLQRYPPAVSEREPAAYPPPKARPRDPRSAASRRNGRGGAPSTPQQPARTASPAHRSTV